MDLDEGFHSFCFHFLPYVGSIRSFIPSFILGPQIGPAILDKSIALNQLLPNQSPFHSLISTLSALMLLRFQSWEDSFHSIPFHSIPFHSIPFRSDPFQVPGGETSPGTGLIRRVKPMAMLLRLAILSRLITKRPMSEGKFSSETESGNVWLDRRYTPPYKSLGFG